ncbi:MAG: helix-turn-helix transcriptional regulator [Clostridia bacterium]|nr:helix-turn-helix transcriptional regulator [Clostridia bacterium]
MKLFENETVNISKIRTVVVYEGKNSAGAGEISRYNVNLSTYELVFFLSGEGITSFAGKTVHDVPNSVRFLPKGIKDGEYTVKKIEKGACIDIYFDTDDEMPDQVMLLKNMNELKPLFIKMHNVWNTKKVGYYSECMSILYDIIRKIKQNREKYNSSDRFEKIQPSYDYMLAHFCEHDFDYKTMCARSGLSYDYFKELFIKRYRMSPVKYVTMLRLDKAKELLITDRYSISEIAEQCGFESVYYFSSVFKKHEGVSPKNYKYNDEKR